ncbi:MAG: hypothetical protein LKI24_04245 [Acidipropionibacterium sp.]|jgi:hypothetical protein|nr:hypothetical protein [Acidipropionibacterium sp.]
MSTLAGFTAQQVREFVDAYEQAPYGTKAAWLTDNGLTRHQIARFRAAVFSGDLERHLIPREGVPMTTQARTRQHEARNGQTPSAQIRAQQARIDILEADLAREREISDALGKAIGLLQQISAHEPTQPQTPTLHRPSTTPGSDS